MHASQKRTLVYHIGTFSIHFGIFAGTRLAHSCRLRLAEAICPGVIAERFFKSVRQGIDCAVFCSASGASSPRIREIISPIIAQVPIELLSNTAHGLEIGYRNPDEFSGVRIAGALGARMLLPGRNVLVVDCAAITSFTALRKDGVIPGGALMHGFSMWPAIAAKVANRPAVRARYRQRCLARSADEGLAAGAYHGHLGALREVAGRLVEEAFGDDHCEIVATGPESKLFNGAGIFTAREPRLVLMGLNHFAQSLT